LLRSHYVLNERLKCLQTHSNESNTSFLFYGRHQAKHTLLDAMNPFLEMGVFESRIPKNWLSERRIRKQLKTFGAGEFLVITAYVDNNLNNTYSFPVITILGEDVKLLPEFNECERWHTVICCEEIKQDEYRRLNMIVRNFRIDSFFKENS